MKYLKGTFFMLLLLPAVLLTGCSTRELSVLPPPSGPGLFSWQKNVLEIEEAVPLFETMNSQGLTTLYQYFPDNVSLQTSRNFLTEAAKYNIQVYFLTGSPEWALDSKGKSMLEAVEQARKINRRLPSRAKLAGIMMDTEPYLLEEWEGHEAAVMDTYLEAMTLAHKKASGAGLRYAACIPFYYDDMGLERYLKLLLTDGCDDLAIMNYSRYREDKHIETELALAREADRPVTVIYELQKPGSHGLTESNTYYYEGLDALKDSVHLLETRFGKDSFQYALHDYRALQEVLYE